MKQIVALLLIFCTIALSGCSDVKAYFDNIHTEHMEAKKFVEDFLFFLGNDIETAKTYLHPNFYAEKQGFDAFVEDFNNQYEVNILDGITIYDDAGGSVGGRGYYPRDNYSYSYEECIYGLIISGRRIYISIEVRKDEYGYGIYTFEEYDD